MTYGVIVPRFVRGGGCVGDHTCMYIVSLGYDLGGYDLGVMT